MPVPLRQIRRRIKSVEGTKKMTRAMEMVAAAKLKRLQKMLAQSDRYISCLARILATLVREKPLAHPLLEQREEVARTHVFLITSDTGLCGSYNANVIERTNRLLEEFAQGQSVQFVALGKNGAGYLKRRGQRIRHSLGIPRPQQIDATIAEITKLATDSFVSREADQVLFIYTHVESLSSLRPRVSRLFPFTPKASEGEEAPETIDYILEPSLSHILEVVLPEYIQAEVGQSVKHALVAEQASRMMAMRQATDNAKKMIDTLTLVQNKVRQATITRELIEVVSGSLAQKK